MKRSEDDVARPRGRPRMDEPGTSVSTWLRPHEHDKLCKLAQQHDMSVSKLVKQLITPKLR